MAHRPDSPAPDPVCALHPSTDDECLDCAIDVALSRAPARVSAIGLGTWIPPRHWDAYLSFVAGLVADGEAGP